MEDIVVSYVFVHNKLYGHIVNFHFTFPNCTATLTYSPICLSQLSAYTLDYPYTSTPPEPREKDAFGLETAGRLMLVPADRFEELVNTLGEVYGEAPGAGGE